MTRAKKKNPAPSGVLGHVIGIGLATAREVDREKNTAIASSLEALARMATSPEARKKIGGAFAASAVSTGARELANAAATAAKDPRFEHVIQRGSAFLQGIAGALGRVANVEAEAVNGDGARRE